MHHVIWRVFRAASVLCALAASGCLSPLMSGGGFFEQEDVRPPVARVRLPDPSDTLTIHCTVRFVMRLYHERTEESFSSHDPVAVLFTKSGITVKTSEGVELGSNLTGAVIYASEANAPLYLNKNPYFGSFVIGREDHQERMVINRLSLEKYLEGVLTPELGERAPNEFEAIKSQAVASRTYALAHLGQYPDAPYDLRADVSDQLYVGASQQRDWVDRAVAATKGEVLMSDGSLIEAYYHSTCGGRTEAIQDVWPKAPKPYLVSVDDDTACHWSKYSEWTETFDQKTLLANLRAYRKQLSPPPIPDFDRILDIRLEGATTGGRYRRMVIVTPQAHWVIASDQIRWALGRPSRPGTILPSSRFTLDLQRTSDGRVSGAVVTGSGYGHGVGMCQCGMIGRARAGETYKPILLHYYTGARIVKLY